MKAEKEKAIKGIAKMPTGIAGFDQMTGGGLPANCASLIIGTPGAGKTVFALQTLATAATKRGEPGVFVAFEEVGDKIIANAATFGWKLPQLMRKHLLFIDARLPEEAVQAGTFEITALLASVAANARKMKARWVVFDAIDILLDMLPDEKLRRREIQRLHHWIETSGLTCIITAKSDALAAGVLPAHIYMAYMVECVILLEHTRHASSPKRSVTLQKYRGSTHAENSVPYLIGKHGIEIFPMQEHSDGYRIYIRRVSTGIPHLDSILAGGVIRGSATLVTGAPGTAKTTLAGKFAEATCQRGERVLYVCFDEAGNEIVRNLGSVNIRLDRFVQNGKLRMLGIVSLARSAEAQLADILEQIDAFRPRALVLDPMSALIEQGNQSGAWNIAYRIIQHCKMHGITILATSLVSKGAPDTETTELNISTLADTWIHLTYLSHSGERNRKLTIVKSRGTNHSNQVREMLLSSTGITLADVYVEEGEVLTGTLRSQREGEIAEHEMVANTDRQRQLLIEKTAIAQLAAQIQNLELDLQNREQMAALEQTANKHVVKSKSTARKKNAALRRADKPSKDRTRK